MYKNLSHYIDELEKAGQLIRVTQRVDPELEISEITDRFSKSEGGGKALLFQNTGTKYPVLTNMMGSDKRIAMALGVERLEELTERLEELLGTALSPKKSLADKLKLLPMLSQVSSWMPRSVRGRGHCQQVSVGSLDELPILKCWPHDGGRFVTLPLVHTVNPATGARNVGMYRMQVFDSMTTGMHWHRHKTGENHYQLHKQMGQRMSVAVCLGGDPAYTYAATAPLPDGIDEYLLAGFLRQKPVELVKCLTNELEVPTDCDFVIEGYVDPTEEKAVEGDFGDHTGFYSLKDLYPRLHVTCITARRDAVYPATLVGIPPQEDAYIAKATERIFLTPIRFAIAPELQNLYMPTQGVAHNLTICTIKKSYPGQGVKVANAMWGAGQMMFNKVMVVKTTEQKFPELLATYNPQQDTTVQRGTLDVLDHTSPHIGFGGKVCIDLTPKLPEELCASIPVCLTFSAPERLAEMVATEAYMPLPQWHTVMVTAQNEYDKSTIANELFGVNDFSGVKILLIFDPQVELRTQSLDTLLWLAASNTDAARDISIINNTLVADCRIKQTLERGFPNIVTMSQDIISRIDDRWGELGLGQFIASPSLEYLPLVVSDSAKIEY